MPIRIDDNLPIFDLTFDLPDYELSSPTLPLWKRFKHGMGRLCEDKLKVCEIPYLVDILREAESVDIVFVIKDMLTGPFHLRKFEEAALIYGYNEAPEKIYEILELFKLYRKLGFFNETDLESFRNRVQEFNQKTQEEKQDQLGIACYYNHIKSLNYTLQKAKEEFEDFDRFFYQLQENQRILHGKVYDINDLLNPDFWAVRKAFCGLSSTGKIYHLVDKDYLPTVGYELFKKTILDSIQGTLDYLTSQDPVELIKLEKERIKAEESQRHEKEAQRQADREAFDAKFKADLEAIHKSNIEELKAGLEDVAAKRKADLEGLKSVREASDAKFKSDLEAIHEASDAKRKADLEAFQQYLSDIVAKVNSHSTVVAPIKPKEYDPENDPHLSESTRQLFLQDRIEREKREEERRIERERFSSEIKAMIEKSDSRAKALDQKVQKERERIEEVNRILGVNQRKTVNDNLSEEGFLRELLRSFLNFIGHFFKKEKSGKA